MLKTLFHIRSEQPSGEAQTLLIEIGADHCSYAFLNKATQTITELKYFAVDELEMEAQLPAVIHEFKDKNFTNVVVCSAYATALLTPLKYVQENGSLLQLIYDQPAEHSFKDAISEWQMVNVHSLPAIIFALLEKEFPSAQFMHAYTPSLKIHNGFGAEDQIVIHFTTQHFRVLVKKGSHVQLAQTYQYKTPLDVVYYLLKICSELQLQQSDVHLVLSGLVEEASALYKELHHYFLNMHFAQTPSVALSQNEYPQHFFTSTYNLAACVL